MFRLTQKTDQNRIVRGFVFANFNVALDYSSVANRLSQINFRHQIKIIKSLESQWKVLSLKNIEFIRSPWKEIGVQLSNLPAEKIFKLFSEYDPYVQSIQNRNIQAIKERNASSERFIKYLFTN